MASWLQCYSLIIGLSVIKKISEGWVIHLLTFLIGRLLPGVEQTGLIRAASLHLVRISRVELIALPVGIEQTPAAEAL